MSSDSEASDVSDMNESNEVSEDSEDDWEVVDCEILPYQDIVSTKCKAKTRNISVGFEQANQLTSHYVISLCMIFYSFPVSRTFLKGKKQFFTDQNPRIFLGDTFLKFRIVNHTYLRTKKGQKKFRVIYTLIDYEKILICLEVDYSMLKSTVLSLILKS